MATYCVGTGVCKGIEEIHQVCVVDNSSFPKQNLGGIQAWWGGAAIRKGD